MNIKTNGGKYILWRRTFAFFSIATLLYNFRERRFVLVHHLRGDSSVVAFHIAARPFRSLLFDAALPFRSGAPARSLGRPRAGLQSVGRARSSVRDVCARRVPFASFHTPAPFNRECEREGTPRREETVVERDGTMAVSQPRPPDRVDAALEKVAPLRYLKAHECARSERTVTRYYHKPLS